MKRTRSKQAASADDAGHDKISKNAPKTNEGIKPSNHDKMTLYLIEKELDEMPSPFVERLLY